MTITSNSERARFNMVEQQVRPWEVLDFRVLEVLRQVPREAYVPERYQNVAYADLAIPLPCGQHMLKPVHEGRILQALLVNDEDEVLLIGGGSGYLAACLAKLGRAVTALEPHLELAQAASLRLQQQHVRNVRFLNVDVSEFVPDRSFDAVAFTGATWQRPDHALRWLKPGGRLLTIHGLSPAQHVELGTFTASSGVLWTQLFETDLPYLVGQEPPRDFTL